MAETDVADRRAPASGVGGMLPDEWPAQVTEAVVKVVGQVHDRTTKPAMTAARAIVFGLFAAILGTVVVVLLCVVAIRLGAVYLPNNVWAVYVGLGALFTVAGALLLSKALAAPPADTDH